MKLSKFYSRTIVIVVFGLFACAQPKSTTNNNADQIATAPTVQKPDTALYEIIAIKHNQTAQNYYVLYKAKQFDEKSLNEFVKKFRVAFCNNKCNIDLYDTKTLVETITKDPVNNEEYLKLADHNIASSTFEMPEVRMYPLQNVKYKELGGHNWKKEHNF